MGNMRRLLRRNVDFRKKNTKKKQTQNRKMCTIILVE